MKELGIEWIAAHSPQAKGRMERCFGTLQDRLVKGLRVAGNLEQAYAYLQEVRRKGERRGLISAGAKPDVLISSPPEFKGEAGLWTPEDMFVASVNACMLTTFLAYAKHKVLDLVDYER